MRHTANWRLAHGKHTGATQSEAESGAPGSGATPHTVPSILPAHPPPRFGSNQDGWPLLCVSQC